MTERYTEADIAPLEREDPTDLTVIGKLRDACRPKALPGNELVVTGHSPGRNPRWARPNVVCIDTGIHFADWGHLTVAELGGPELTLHRFAQGEGERAGA